MRRLVRVLRILGKSVLALLVLSVVTLGILRVVWGRQLAAEMEAIKARGEPLTMADLAQPQVPDSQNAALVYEQAFKELSAFDSAEEEIVEALDKGDWARAAELLSPYDHVVPLLERATSMPQCVFPPHGRQNEFADRPEVKLRTLACFLGYKARTSAGQGDADEAIHCIRLIVRMRAGSGRQARLMAFLCDVTRFSIASSALRKCAAQVTINEAQAKELHEAFGKVDIGQLYIGMLVAERAYTSDSLSLQRTDLKRWFRKTLGPQHKLPPLYTDPIGLIWIKVFSLKDQAAYLHSMTQVIDSVGLSYRRFESRGIGEKGVPFYAIITRMLGTTQARTFSTYSRSRADIAGSQIFLALLAYHDRYGSYPQTLEELRSKLGWPLEKDPFTGDDFVYRRQGEGFILYSLDEDLQDNGGLKFTKGSEYGTPRDIVWTVHR